jgi:hypothetical protein
MRDAGLPRSQRSRDSKFGGASSGRARHLRMSRNALLDKADTVFGTRTEANDVNDRYANRVIGYLPQRFESLTGFAVPTSNRRHLV